MSRGLLWHYTDTAGLLGILNDQVLWASSCSFLNDPAEEHFAQNAMRLALGRLGRRSHPLGVGCEGYVSWDPDLRGAFSRRFVACATEARDALEVWRAYGPGSVPGTFALGLDPTVPLGLLSDHETASRERLPPLPSSWQRVRYWSVDEAAAWIEDELSTRLDARQRSASASTSRSDQAEGATFGDVDPHAWQDLDEVFTAVLACAKHRAYAAEREHRISLEVALQPPFPLRQGPDGPVPYVRLTAASSWGAVVRKAAPLPIREIMTWPGAPPTAWQGVAAALESAGYVHDRDPGQIPSADGAVRLSTSHIPFA